MADDKACKIETVTGSHTNNELVSNANAFNACSREDRRDAIRTLQEIGQPGKASTTGTEASKILNGVEVVYDSVGGKITHVQPEKPLPDGTPKPARAGQDHPGTDAAGTLDKAHKRETPAKPQPKDTGRPGVDDEDTRLTRQWISPENKTKANEVVKKMLNGDDVSGVLNGANRDDKKAILAEAVGQLAEKPGSKVKVSEDNGIEGNRYISIETADKTKVLVTESKFGSPRDILVNANHWYDPGKFMGAKDIYDRPGEAEQKKAAEAAGSGGPTWRDKLLGPDLKDGNGPLARMLRGEDVTAEELADLKKKGFVYEPKSREPD